MQLFEKISKGLPPIYRTLTGNEGTASLLISDNRDKPFESEIFFDFCPPGKRNGVDLENLSGGEKTMAALAFVFTIVKVVNPAILIMDEVDAFLDESNVSEIAAFL